MYLKLISIKSVRPCRRWFLKSEDISRGLLVRDVLCVQLLSVLYSAVLCVQLLSVLYSAVILPAPIFYITL